MRFRYDPEADALYIRFQEGDVGETDEVFPGVMLNVDNNGNLLGLEVLNASSKTPTSISGGLHFLLQVE
jgi:uncharacterized protein YuzE